MSSRSLTVVGSGIQAGGQVTIAARGCIERAGKVLYALSDAVSVEWIRKCNPSAESLSAYVEDRPRRDTYSLWVEQMLEPVRDGKDVCVVFYGHPGLCVDATHEAVRRARQEGYEARMMPAVSAADCLFADLGINPIRDGCRFLDATDFLVRRRSVDTSSELLLWQIDMIGEKTYRGGEVARQGLIVLGEVLQEHYGTKHEVIIYEASPFAIIPPRIDKIPLSELGATDVTGASTLYVPPLRTAEYDPEMLERLQIDAP